MARKKRDFKIIGKYVYAGQQVLITDDGYFRTVLAGKNISEHSWKTMKNRIDAYSATIIQEFDALAFVYAGSKGRVQIIQKVHIMRGGRGGSVFYDDHNKYYHEVFPLSARKKMQLVLSLEKQVSKLYEKISKARRALKPVKL